LNKTACAYVFLYSDIQVFYWRNETFRENSIKAMMFVSHSNDFPGEIKAAIQTFYFEFNHMEMYIMAGQFPLNIHTSDNFRASLLPCPSNWSVSSPNYKNFLRRKIKAISDYDSLFKYNHFFLFIHKHLPS